MVAGNTTTFGTGAWEFSLPINAASVEGVQMACSLLDNGVSWYAAIVNGSYLGLFDRTAIITSQPPSFVVDSNNPFPWGDADSLQFNGSYEGI